MNEQGRTIPLVDLSVLHATMQDDLRRAFERVLASSTFTSGPEVESFEGQLAEFLGVDHVVGVGSGTAALQLTLTASGIRAGDEVIMPPNSFFATAEAVLNVGAVPVFADVDPMTALLDVDAAAAAITPRTAAIIGVHLYGQPVSAAAFGALAAKHGLLFLEDAARGDRSQLVRGVRRRDGRRSRLELLPREERRGARRSGGSGHSRPGGGAKVRILRSHGEVNKYVHVTSGSNERLDELQAAFLTVKLARIDEMQRLRDEAAETYAASLRGVPTVTMLRRAPGVRHVHHLLVVTVNDRDRLRAEPNADGIGAGVHYPVPTHLEPACAGLADEGAYPNAEELARTVLSLPLFPGITDSNTFFFFFFFGGGLFRSVICYLDGACEGTGRDVARMNSDHANHATPAHNCERGA